MTAALVSLTDAPAGARSQPLAQVHWAHRDVLQANDWNPNHVSPPERRLLKLSIVENGWTQPIVIRDHGDHLEIVDGYHRWLTAADREVYAMTGGFVPVVLLPQCDADLARLATIRHNRARGTHGVVPMANIVCQLLESGMSPEEIGHRLEMDPEEVDRLSDRGGMPLRAGVGEFGKGWEASRDTEG